MANFLLIWTHSICSDDVNLNQFLRGDFIWKFCFKIRSHSKINFKNISPLFAVSILPPKTVSLCRMWGTDFPVIIIANLRSTRFSRSNLPFSYKYKKGTILDWNFHVRCLLIIEETTVSIKHKLNYDPCNDFKEPNKILVVSKYKTSSLALKSEADPDYVWKWNLVVIL